MKRLFRALLYSLSGLRAAWKGEAAFRQEVLLAAALLPAAFILAPDRAGLALMVLSVLVVLVAELLNTAIESAIDRFGGEIHPLAKKAKDTASAAVLIALIAVAAVWGIVLWPAA